jgi:signal transduction histidine kinase
LASDRIQDTGECRNAGPGSASGRRYRGESRKVILLVLLGRPVEGRGRVWPVFGLPVRAHTVFVHVLLSAAQALELQPGTITIGTESDEQGVVVMSGDTGRGIEPEPLPRIFDPFFTTRRPGQGTGMGLEVCHGTMSRHGDAIDLESAHDRGTLATAARST